LRILPVILEVAQGGGIEKAQRQQRGIGGIVVQRLAVIAGGLIQIMLAGGKARRQIGREGLRVLAVGGPGRDLGRRLSARQREGERTQKDQRQNAAHRLPYMFT
jgi:hypothetical protein